jgi:hypothetical protein
MSEPHPPQAGHEIQDVNINAIFSLAGLSIVLGGAIGLGVWWLFRDMHERQLERMPMPSPLAMEQRGQLPPQPQLEGIERMKSPWATPLRQESQAPRTFGWVDRQAQIVRIPVDRAMAIIVDKKLIPSKSASSIENLNNPYAALPSPANSGRPAPKEQP